jgi:hypothetical protein
MPKPKQRLKKSGPARLGFKGNRQGRKASPDSHRCRCARLDTILHRARCRPAQASRSRSACSKERPFASGRPRSRMTAAKCLLASAAAAVPVTSVDAALRLEAALPGRARTCSAARTRLHSAPTRPRAIRARWPRRVRPPTLVPRGGRPSATQRAQGSCPESRPPDGRAFLPTPVCDKTGRKPENRPEVPIIRSERAQEKQDATGPPSIMSAAAESL